MFKLIGNCNKSNIMINYIFSDQKAKKGEQCKIHEHHTQKNVLDCEEGLICQPSPRMLHKLSLRPPPPGTCVVKGKLCQS